MTNPVLVEVTRGPAVESRHRGAISVMDGDGATVLAVGDVEKPVFPRSAIKTMQAIPMIENGAADAYALSDAQLSLICSSHSGEEAHIAEAAAILEKAGLTEEHLECGGHWSFVQRVAIEQARQYDSVPGAICNNCSGKHSGFLCSAAHQGIDPTGYVKPDHPIQQQIKAVLEDLTGAQHGEAQCGTDGCSIPTYAVPLEKIAHGFAKMASGQGLSTNRAAAAKRLLDACMAEPFYMAGTKRFCTRLMQLGGGRLFAKTGAEGVFCGAIPELGLGIALKCDDGTTRAAETMMAATMAQLLPAADSLQEGLASLATKPLKNWNGWDVGSVRIAYAAFNNA